MVVKYVITIAVMLVIMIVQYKHYHHLLAAPVVYPVMWMLAFVGLIIAGDTFYEVSTGTCVVFVAGYVLFCFGFKVAEVIKKPRYAEGRQTTDEYAIDYDVNDQRLGLNIVTGICVFTGLAYALLMVKMIDFGDLYQSLLRIRSSIKYGEVQIPYLLTILRYFIRCSLWYISLQLFRIPWNSNKKDKEGYDIRLDLIVRIAIILASGLFIVIADFSRNDILFTFLPVLFIYILSRRLSDRKCIVFLFTAFIVFSVFFIWFKEYKNGTLDEEFDAEDAQDRYIQYLSGSLVAFDVKIKSENLKLVSKNGGQGRYTLSLIYAFRDMFLGTNDTPSVIRDRSQIGFKPTTITNVYTIYDWTGMDYGLLYALFWQIMLGIMYGILYFETLKQRMGATFWYSVLSYPLVIMFFQDQFFSISQSWFIIISICYGIFFICNKATVKIRSIEYRVKSNT
ncbi:MAG: oligosaccharide repeat unit polymerase [Lachnospiraceae bacterium]|nr:oligosaccharide repeat unit polymerase [Lachnospiraceae bacterium]